MLIQHIEGGVTAPKGFKAAGIHCGIKKGGDPEKLDLALIVSDNGCAAAGVYTTNLVKAAPVLLTMKHLDDGKARAVIINSGNANARAPEGDENALKMAACLADAMKIPITDVALASTGVIGQRLNIEAIENAVPELVRSLEENGENAARAIMTTDTVKKDGAVSYEYDGKTVTIGGMCKGSGMIHPNMGTLLCFLTTDAAIAPALLQKALKCAVDVSINRISVDGDMSTNDTCLILANGLSGTDEINAEDEAYKLFCEALETLLVKFARMLAADGEGATKLITCTVKNAPDVDCAVKTGKAVIGSSLVKSALFGSDANWGRVICAMGYSDTDFDPEKVDIAFASDFGEVEVCRSGCGLSFDEDKAKKILSEKEVIININMNAGECGATCWGCDLTYDYVRINGDYRS